MKTQWKATVGIVSIGLIISACQPPAPEPPAAQPPAAQSQVAPPQAAQPAYEIVNIEGNLYQAGVRGMGAHTTVFVVTPDGVILADPINANFSQWLRNELQERFDTHVEYVLYSHHHPDHASGGGTFADTATFVAHENMAEALNGLPSNYAPMDVNGNGMIDRSEAGGGVAAGFDRDDSNGDNMLSAAEINANIHAPDITYQDELTISFGGATVELHHTPPAHTDDMSVLLFPEQDVVFVVDFLQINRFPGGASGFLAGYSVDNYEAAVDAVMELDFDTVIQGHSELIGTRADVAEFMALVRSTERDVAAAIAAGRSVEEALDSVMLPEYSDWLLYETRRPQLVSNMYEYLSQN